MSYFRTTRNVELSLLYHLDINLSVDWSGTTVCRTFKEVYAKDVALPIVCVRLSDTNTVFREIGATTLENRYLIILDIFARSDGQRLDIADYIKDKLKDGWVHYEHSHASGDNTSLSRSANGRDNVVDWVTDAEITTGENADAKDRFRHNISIRVRRSNP